MKFLHTADLHIGRKLGERDLYADQEYILSQIRNIAVREHVDGILIAGDVYDRANPSGDAITLFDRFITDLAEHGIAAYIIAGNHDSSERLGYGSGLFRRHKIHIAGEYTGTVPKIRTEDEYGPVNIYLLPNLRTNTAKTYLNDDTIETLDEAVRCIVSSLHPDTSERNIIVAHQFLTSAKTSESETATVGTLDEIPADIFRDFDYTALGHLHIPQHIGTRTVRYSGSPLKYSKSEKDREKSVVILTLNSKGDCEIKTVPLSPLHDVREITGPINQLISPEIAGSADCSDYIYISFTDDTLPEFYLPVIEKTYPNYIKIERKLPDVTESADIKSIREIETADPMTLISEFYEKQQQKPLSDLQRRILAEIIRELAGPEVRQ